MTTYHAVVWMDQKEAHVMHFDAEAMQAERVKSRSHHQRAAGQLQKETHHAGMTEKEEAEYFGGVAQALEGAKEVLVVGPGRMHEEFKAWTEKHLPAVGKSIVGSEKADHPTDGQIVALARRYFHKFDNLAGNAGGR